MLRARFSQKFYTTFGAKSDKIKIIRQQYDAFLNEDKKRKERNEYILNRLDKMRCCDSIVPYRPKVHFVDDHQSFRYAPLRESAIANISARPQMLNPVISTPIIEESKILEEISKKFILIPKLNTALDNNESLPSKTNVKPSYDDNDWKSKYDILNQLKKEEKEGAATSDHTEGQNDKALQMIQSEIGNKKQTVTHSGTTEKLYDKYEEPERDNNFETLEDSQKSLDEPTYKTDLNGMVVNCAAIEANHDLNRSEEESSNTLLSANKKESELLKPLASDEITTEQKINDEAVELETDNDQQKISTKIHGVNIIMPDGPKSNYNSNSDVNNQYEKRDYRYEADQKITQEKISSSDVQYEEQNDLRYLEQEISNEYNIANYTEDANLHKPIADTNVQNVEQNQVYSQDYVQEVSNEYNKDNYAEGENAQEGIANTDEVQHEEQNQAYSQGYEQVSNDYIPANYTEAENLVYDNETYAYEDPNQQYYQDPNVNKNQEYQEQQYEGQAYETLQQNSDNSMANAANEDSNDHYLSQLGANEENENAYFPQKPMVQDTTTTEKTSNVSEYQYQDNSDDIHPIANSNYVEGIQDYESEANLYYNIEENSGSPADPIVANEDNLQPLVQEGDYEALIEANQIASDPLDMYDHDATLQKYDQSYEDQYAGNYEEVVSNTDNTQVAYAPYQTEELEAENETLANIEGTLDNEQGYVVDVAPTNPDDGVVQNIKPEIK